MTAATDSHTPVGLAKLEFAEAHLLAGELADAGIPHWIEEPMRWDDFAVAQRLIAGGWCTVFVPEARLADARELLAGAQREGRLRSATTPRPYDPAAAATRRRQVLRILSILLLLQLLVLLAASLLL